MKEQARDQDAGVGYGVSPLAAAVRTVRDNKLIAEYHARVTQYVLYDMPGPTDIEYGRSPIAKGEPNVGKGVLDDRVPDA